MQLPSSTALSSAFSGQDASRQYWIRSVSEDVKDLSEEAKSKAGELKDKAVDAKADVLKHGPFGKIEMHSGKYYFACMIGGLLATGSTHWGVTPLDLVKVRKQVDPNLYKSNMQGWRQIIAKDGWRGLYTGGMATYIGYSFQGAGKYGFYEIFKKLYSDIVGEEIAKKYKTGIYLAGSASAEVIADVMLCPWEAIKVRMQSTIPPFATTTREAWGKIVAAEGMGGLYKGISPLWARQIPYTMMKFASFENIVQAMWARIPGEKKDYSKSAQIGVSFVSGYLAGILCAVISHPADVAVSKLNNSKTSGESTGAALRRMYSEIGFMGFWGGLSTRIVMVGTLTGLQWLGYDSFKVYCGLPTTG